ncbi:MAG: hypothetical protein NTX65_12870 [Ignavibacteriales bacterium]|nr:hypothetical protein [Ignavibacteriales bacterium]
MLNMLLIITSLIGFNNFGNSNSDVKTYSSKAFDLKDGKFLYSEFHEEKFNGDKITESVTKYKDPKNNLLSERIMTFTDDLTKPKFVLKDLRSGYIEGSELLQNNRVRVYTRESFDDKLEEKVLKVEEPFVIDGGLTYFFRENWERLLNNETIEFNFIAPAKLDYFRFRVSKNSIVSVGNKKGMQLKLEINSFILRAFVDPILITYALDNKEILSYKGISNVNDENGKSHSVEIDFTVKGDK